MICLGGDGLEEGAESSGINRPNALKVGNSLLLDVRLMFWKKLPKG